MPKLSVHTIFAAVGAAIGTVSAALAAVSALPAHLTPEALIAGLGTVAVAVVSHGLFSASTAEKVTKVVQGAEPAVDAAVKDIPGLKAQVANLTTVAAKHEGTLKALETKAAPVVADASAIADAVQKVLEGPAMVAATPPAA